MLIVLKDYNIMVLSPLETAAVSIAISTAQSHLPLYNIPL